MGNPNTVSTAQTIATAWGNDVVSRVVGVYASLAAAETDGRTDDGAVISLTDGSVWLRWVKWHRIFPVALSADFDAVDLTLEATVEELVPDTEIMSLGDGAAVFISAIATCQVTVVVASKVQIRIGLSRTGTSTWTNGRWHAVDLTAGDHVVPVLAYLQAASLTGSVYFRMQVKANPMATTADVSIAGQWTCRVDPGLYYGT